MAACRQRFPRGLREAVLARARAARRWLAGRGLVAAAHDGASPRPAGEASFAVFAVGHLGLCLLSLALFGIVGAALGAASLCGRCTDAPFTALWARAATGALLGALALLPVALAYVAGAGRVEPGGRAAHPADARRATLAVVAGAAGLEASERGGGELRQNVADLPTASRRREVAEVAFAHTREGVLVTDAAGAIIDANDAFCRLMGYERGEIIGRNPRMFASGRHDAAFFREMWRELGARGSWMGEVWDRRKSGEIFAGLLSVAAVQDAHGRPARFVGVLRDITAIQERTAGLERMAQRDALTGLANRLVLMDRLRQAMAQARRDLRPLAVAFIDLDGFKAVNDRLGHEAGDKLLVEVARRMQETLRQSDTLARVGGDEFVAVLRELGDELAIAPTCLRLLEAVAQPGASSAIVPWDTDAPASAVSASIGVAFYEPPEAATAEQLLRRADEAMYAAKLAGKGRFQVYEGSPGRGEVSRGEHLLRLRRALVAGELVVHYQPKVDLRSFDFVGVEALLRWQHPAQGLLGPADFLPQTDGDALGLEIDAWVIEAVLSQLESWRRAGLDIPVSANLSGAQLRQPRFPEQLRTALAAHPGIAPGDLELELVEASALDDLRRTARLVETCRALSVDVSLDDFGTGGSSIAELRALPVPEVKIDRGFVRDMLEDPADLELLAGATRLATAFGRRVVAGGIETLEQAQTLLALGCVQGQGHAIAPPMSAEALPRWIAGWAADPHRPRPRACGPADLSLLLAAVELRAWTRRFESELASAYAPLTAPPCASVCRLGDWLRHAAGGGRGTTAALAELAATHRRLHEHAEALAALWPSGDAAGVTERLAEFRWTRDRLFELARRAAVEASLGELPGPPPERLGGPSHDDLPRLSS